MRLDEIKRLEGIEATEIKEDCWEIAASKGFCIKIGDTYTDAIYMGKNTNADITLVNDEERRKAERTAQYKDKTLDDAKMMLTAEIEAYDLSENVNSFELNGEAVWLDKATRGGLMNSTTIAKAAGQQETTLWLGEDKIVVGCDMAIGLLSRLEMYALECYNVTARHKKEVQELKSIAEAEAYDIKEGYPERLKFSIA